MAVQSPSVTILGRSRWDLIRELIFDLHAHHCAPVK